ncbi:MAG: DUF481 domain-containing protein [Candidatus Thermochlorobacter sp.]
MPIVAPCRRSFSTLCSLLLIATTAYAQVNTESLLRNTRGGFSARLGSGFSLNAGNSEFFRWQADARLDYQTDLLYAFAVGNIERGTANEQVFLNCGFAHLRLMLNVDTLFHPEVFAQREFNEFILLKERTLAGAGARLGLLHLSPNDSVMSLRLTLGIGAMWENEKFTGENLETKLLRSTNYLAVLWRITKSTSLQIIGYFQVDITRLSDYRILIDGSLHVGITDALALSLTLNYRYDNEPVPTVRPFDVDLRNTVTFSF